MIDETTEKPKRPKYTPLRLPDDLVMELKRLAKRDARSMNNYVVLKLQEVVERQAILDAIPFGDQTESE